MRHAVRPVSDPAAGRTLATVRRAFARWRTDPTRPRRIPAPLWRAAVALARAHGVSQTARALGLDYYALARRLRVGPQRAPRPAFVELPWPALAPGPDARLELEDARGARLRVELRGAARPDVEAFARVLWSAAR